MLMIVIGDSCGSRISYIGIAPRGSRRVRRQLLGLPRKSRSGRSWAHTLERAPHVAVVRRSSGLDRVEYRTMEVRTRSGLRRQRCRLLFVAGHIINIAFVTGTDEQLAGPANLLMIAAGLMLLWRPRSMLAPDGWRNAGVGRFPRFAMVFLVVYLVLLTVLVSWIVRCVIDFDVLTESQEGCSLRSTTRCSSG